MAPPWLAARLARLLLRVRGGEHIVGDLDELYALRAERDGKARAVRRYLRDVVASLAARLRPGAGRSRFSAPTPTHPPKRAPLVDIPTDLRLALRSLVREPGFSLVAILTLALGVGAITAVFGMANQLLLRPLPGVPNTSTAAYLQFVRTTDSPGFGDEGSLGPIALVDFDEIRKNATLLEGMASYGNARLRLSEPGQRPTYVRASEIYGAYFQVLGVSPAAGRLLRADETGVDANPSRAVISERFWASQFGRDVDPVGRTLILNDHAFTIVGVAGGGFRGAARGDENDVWLPHSAMIPLYGRTRESLTNPGNVSVGTIVTTVAPHVSTAAAEAEVAQLFARLTEGSSDHAHYLAALEPELFRGLSAPPRLRAQWRSTVLLFAGIGTFVLLIACANVANLLLGRNAARKGASATRRALGATRMRIAREQLARSLVLGLLGVVAGLGLAWLITLLFRGQSIGRVPLKGFSLDWRVLFFASGAALFSAVLFGTAPALLAGHINIEAVLRASGDRTTRRVSALGVIMSAGQLALTLTLLVGAALLGRTVYNLYTADMGLNLDRLSEIPVVLTERAEPEELDALSRSIVVSVESLPEVEAAALSTQMPHLASGFLDWVQPDEAPGAEPTLEWGFGVTPGWFELFGIEADRGRTLQDGDWAAESTRPVVITAALARSQFGGIDVVGRRLLVGRRDPEEFEIVGVVADTYSTNDLDEPRRAFFVTPGAQLGSQQLVVFARTDHFDPQVADRLRDAVGALVPDVPLERARPLSTEIDIAHAEQRILSRLLTLLSSFAILLSSVGLYGVVAFDVAGRQREFGIRSAVGAEARHIAQLVFRHASAIVLLGSLFGLGGAYALSRILESRLFRVAAFDPASYGAAAGLLALATAGACVLPTLKATRVDPMATLKTE